MATHVHEVEAGERFEFGRNWQQFLDRLDAERIATAEESLRAMFGRSDLDGLTFLDVGSGSGLFSLAAHRLGARVLSVDFDPQSVECTRRLRDTYGRDGQPWDVRAASILDPEFVAGAGKFDIVYSWGVLHHTGDMALAFENAARLVSDSGTLSIAIYNDQGRPSRYWLRIKQLYNKTPPFLRWLVVAPCMLGLWGPTILRDTLKGSPLATWRQRKAMRGMDPWRDAIDWIGGLPFEVATPEQVFDFFHTRGFGLDRLRTCAGGLGCNEFVFKRSAEI